MTEQHNDSKSIYVWAWLLRDPRGELILNRWAALYPTRSALKHYGIQPPANESGKAVATRVVLCVAKKETRKRKGGASNG